MKKLKVVWIAPYNIVRFNDIISLKRPRPSFCPWIEMLLDSLRLRSDIELHLISYSHSISRVKKIYHENIHYYFIPHGMPVIMKGWPDYLPLGLWSRFYFLSKKIKKIVNDIHPDLIHLHGTENPYSRSVLFLDYPVIISIQGFASKVYEHNPTAALKIRKQIEEEIIRKKNHFIVRSQYMINKIKEINPNADFYFNHYPTPELTNVPEKPNKTHDIIFAARIVKNKGIEDLILACAKVKKNHPRLTVKIVGRGTLSYVERIKEMIREKGLEKNVTFVGFVPTQEEVLLHELSGRICVLPTYYDNSPGTIRECLKLGIPVVSYKVDDIPDLVQDGRSGLLVDPGDIDALANAILELITNSEKRKQMSMEALSYANRHLDNRQISNNLIEIYHKFLEKY